MSIGKQILELRQKRNMTRAEFAELFHVTRQTISNWENEKSYPDLQILVDMSNIFSISLDQLLKEDTDMIKAIDRERSFIAHIKRRNSVIDMLTGTGTGLLISCLFSAPSEKQLLIGLIGIVLFFTGAYLKNRHDKTIVQYLENRKDI
ncbi:MAG: helix-turn-helix domain-containing protein [Lachnospiraceae bacterium]